MFTSEVQAFLTHLVLEEHISASTQNQALSALLFLYCNVLSLEIGRVDLVRQAITTCAHRVQPRRSAGFAA